MKAQQAGFIDGKFTTTKSGQSAFHVPIKVPSGTARMEPSIALSYLGSQRNGLLGVGFTLNGLPTIARAGQTVAQDGKWTGVDYSPNDRFTLAGERLIAVKGVYGAPGTEYRTERESWSRIVSHGQVGGGPEWFEVTNRSGRKMLFGADPSARVPIVNGSAIRVWALDRVTDRNGNFYTVSYDLDAENGTHRPVVIDYTGNAGAQPALAPHRRVEFSYEDRSDPVHGYSGGHPHCQTQRLATVSTRVGGELVRTYSLGYREAAVTGRSELETIVESDGQGVSLPPLTLTRPLETTSWLASPVTLPPVQSGSIPEDYTLLTGDLTGDGRTDLILVWPQGNSEMLEYAVFLAQSDGTFAAPIIRSTQCSLAGGQFGPVPVDVDGNGRTDLVLLYMQGENLVYSTFVWKNGEFSVSAPVPLGLDELPQGLVPQIVPLDLNGNGKSDLFVPFQSANQTLSYYVLASNGAGYAKLGPAKTLPIPMGDDPMLSAANISGSPIQSIVYGYGGDSTTDIYTLIFDGSKFAAQEPLHLTEGVGDGNYLFPIDATGDGLTDFAFIWQNEVTKRTHLTVLVSDGARIVAPRSSAPPLDLGENPPAISAVDLTGDGRTDLLLYSLDGSGKTVVTPYLAKNGTFVVQPSVPTALDVQPSAMATPDIRGVGKNDLLVATSGGTKGSLQLHVFHAAAPKLGLIDTIGTGISGSTSLEYLPVTDERVYSESAPPPKGLRLAGRSAAASVAPVQFGGAPGSLVPSAVRRVIEIPLNLVWRVTRADGRGRSFTKEHHYEDGLVSLDGRGWLGFATSTETDFDASSATATAYHQTFPLTGMAITESTGAAGQKQPLRVKSYEYAVAAPTAPGVFATQLAQSTTTLHAELTGNSASHGVRHTYDDFGNRLTSAYSSARAGGAADLFTTRVFENDTDGWCLGLLQSSMVSADAAGQRLLRRQDHTYDPITKQLKSSRNWNSTDPGDSPTRLYGYDRYGNRVSIAVSSGALTTQAFGPETAYTYPNARVRKASDTTSLKDSYGYDPRFGVLVSHRDPNGNVRSRTLDGLGRVTSVSSPGPNGPVVLQQIERQIVPGAGYSRTTAQIQSWDGSLRKITRRYFDGLGRRYSTVTQGTGDPPVAPRIVDRQLDGKGRETGRSLPYHPGTPVLWARTTFDPLGRVIERVRPIGPSESSVTKIWYDGIDRTIVRGQGSPDAVSTAERRQFYGGRPRVIGRTDGLGRLSTFRFDPLGQIEVATPPAGAAQNVRYDSLGVPTQLEGPAFGRVAMTSNFAQRRQSVAYANGGGFQATFDLLNRPLEVSLSDGSGYVMRYDDPGPGNGMGRLASVSAFRSRSELLYTWRQQYDEFGRKTSLQLSIDGSTHTQQRSYSPTGLLEELVFHDKGMARYSYDGLSQIRKLTFTSAEGQKQTIATYDSYNVFGRPEAGSAGNGNRRQWRYTEGGKLQEQVVEPGQSGPVLLARSFARDTFGRLLTISDAATGKVLGGYEYDGAGQVCAWADSERAARQIRFDEEGNVLATGTRTLSYGDGGSTIVVTPSGGTPYTLTSDASGNRIKRTSQGEPERSFTYDALNRLVATQSVGFVYGHRGQRLVKFNDAGQRTVYLTPNDIISPRDSGRTAVKLLRDPHGITAVVETLSGGGQRTYFLERDHVESTVLVTEERGAVVAAPRYEPFGRLLNPTPGQSPFLPGFAGQPLDPETGLAYFNARYLDPDIGRFITADTRLGGSLTTTNALNRYAYSLNDPINLADPGGHSIFDWLFSGILDLLEIVGGAIAAVFGAEPLAGALIGAGVGGLAYEGMALVSGQSFSWAAWGIAEGIGAVTGLTMGATAEVDEAAVAGDAADDAGEGAIEDAGTSGESSDLDLETISDEPSDLEAYDPKGSRPLELWPGEDSGEQNIDDLFTDFDEMGEDELRARTDINLRALQIPNLDEAVNQLETAANAWRTNAFTQ